MEFIYLFIIIIIFLNVILFSILELKKNIFITIIFLIRFFSFFFEMLIFLFLYTCACVKLTGSNHRLGQFSYSLYGE